MRRRAPSLARQTGRPNRVPQPTPVGAAIESQHTAIHAESRDLIFLNYHHFNRHFNILDFVRYLHGAANEAAIAAGLDRLSASGLTPQIRQDNSRAAFRRDLPAALAVDSAIVCYHGHLTFTRDSLAATGLVADDRRRSADVTNAEVRRLAATARAKVFMMVGCSSHEVVPRSVPGETAVVAFNPGRGKHFVDATHSGRAMKAFFDYFLFRDPAWSVDATIAAANVVLAKEKLISRLVLASGLGSLTRARS